MTRSKVLLLVFIFLTPGLRAEAASSDLGALQKLVQDLQAQLASYQRQVENQTKMIEVQGKEIADLKNHFEASERKSTTTYIVPKDQQAFKENVLDVVRDFQLSEKQETPKEKELRTIYDDGFYLTGKDDTLKIGGWYQGDLDFYNRANAGNNRFRNRRVRLDIRGVLEDYFEYRIFTQFAGSAANLQEAWLTYKYFPSVRIRFGQVFVPFSLESQYSARWLDFIEKSIGVANLEPGEDLGLMVFGNPFGGVVEYAAGVFNGRARTLEDNNDNFDVATRVVLAPFKKSKNELLKDLYIGGSLTEGRSNETLASTGFTTAGGSGFFTYNSSVRQAAARTRYDGELQWIYGPGDIKAEYLGTTFSDLERLSVKDDVKANAWYVSASYILTGERKVRDKGINPKRPFSIKEGGWGAWEAALRFEQFFVNRSPIDLGLATGTNRVDAYTIGLNWWPNKHVRLMFDYVFNNFNDPVLFGSKSQDSEHLWLNRVQYNF